MDNTTNNKTILESKTFWTAIISLIAVIVQQKYGYVISPVYETYILIAINVILRAITKDTIVWSTTPVVPVNKV